MYNGRTWYDKKKVVVWGTLREWTRGEQRVSSVFAGIAVGALLVSILFGEDNLSDVQNWLAVSTFALPVIICGMFGPRWLALKWQTLEEKGLADSGSYAFSALRDRLAEHPIRIREMNDWYDHAVGVVHITAFLKRTRAFSLLIEDESLNEVWRERLKADVDKIASRYADLITGCFDQRELARQARERGERYEAQRIEAGMVKQVKAFYLAERAELLLSCRNALSI